MESTVIVGAISAVCLAIILLGFRRVDRSLAGARSGGEDAHVVALRIAKSAVGYVFAVFTIILGATGYMGFSLADRVVKNAEAVAAGRLSLIDTALIEAKSEVELTREMLSSLRQDDRQRTLDELDATIRDYQILRDARVATDSLRNSLTTLDDELASLELVSNTIRSVNDSLLAVVHALDDTLNSVEQRVSDSVDAATDYVMAEVVRSRHLCEWASVTEKIPYQLERVGATVVVKNVEAATITKMSVVTSDSTTFETLEKGWDRVFTGSDGMQFELRYVIGSGIADPDWALFRYCEQPQPSG